MLGFAHKFFGLCFRKTVSCDSAILSSAPEPARRVCVCVCASRDNSLRLVTKCSVFLLSQEPTSRFNCWPLLKIVLMEKEDAGRGYDVHAAVCVCVAPSAMHRLRLFALWPLPAGWEVPCRFARMVNDADCVYPPDSGPDSVRDGACPHTARPASRTERGG